jgi:hypothetical protein
MAGAGCELSHDTTRSASSAAMAFKMKCNSAIQNLIGAPNPIQMKKAARAHEEFKTKKTKKKWNLETLKYLEHEKLYEELVSYSMIAGKETNYNTELVDPIKFTESWRSVFARSLRGEITPHTIKQGARKALATRNLVKRVIRKREKLMRKDKISRAEIAWMPPEYIVNQFDKFGFIGGLVSKILTMGDNNVQKAHKFTDPINKAKNQLVSYITNKLKQDKTFTIGTKSLGGIKGFFTTDGEAVIIHDVVESAQHGEDVYDVTFPDRNDPDARKLLPKDELSKDLEDVENALISQYADELMAEIGDGQVRKIVPKVVLHEDDDGYTEFKNGDLVKINAILDAMQTEGEKDDPKKVPGVHTQRKTITNAQGNEEKWEFSYVMIKQGEMTHELSGQKGESYNTYLINKKQVLSDGKLGDTKYFIGRKKVAGKIIEDRYTQSDIEGILEAGYYRSDSNENFGKHTFLNKKETVIDGEAVEETTELNDDGSENSMYTEENVEGSQKKNWVDFKFMDVQPDKNVMKHLWKSMEEIREIYGNAFETLRSQDLAIQKKRDKLHQAVIKWRIDKGDSHEQAGAWLSEQLEKLGVAQHIKVNAKGNLVTSSTYSKKKKENYFPQLYSRISVFFKQLPKAIGDLEEKRNDYLDENPLPDGSLRTKEFEKAQGIYEGGQLQRFDEGLKHLTSILEEQDLNRDISFLHDLNSMKHLKHITAWTDPLQRRKDGQIHNDYFNKSFNAIHKNEVMVELMEAVYKMTRLSKNLPQGSIDYIVNRVKIAFGDPTSRAQGLFKEKPEAYEEMGKTLNGLPSWILGGTIHDGKSAERLTKWITAPATMMFLGGSSALGNSAQIVNQIMRVGWKISGQAHSEWKSTTKGEGWKDIIKNTGILNTITMFQDIMMKGGSSKLADVGLVNFGGIPIPMPNMFQFGKLLKKGRNSFIDNGAGEMEDFLLQLLQQEQNPQALQDIIDLKKADKLRQGIKNKDLRKKRGALYDIFTLPEETSEKVIKGMFKELITNVSDNKLKQMVSWKLSWWFNSSGAPGEDVFTFTKSEERLRSLTVIMALMHAQATGLLGSESSKWEDQFMTDNAVRIARNAVYYTQFGMTPPYLGEAFNGIGRALWQYKQYPTLQMIHDGEIVNAFRDGNYSVGDGFTRITKAISDATIKMAGGTLQGIAPTMLKGKKINFSYDPADPDLDHEAIAMARWIFTRGIASVIASIVGVIPFLGKGIRTFAPTLPIYSLFRGAENPAFGLLTRAAIWIPMIMYGLDDDEDEDLINDLTNSVGFLFTPVIIGLFLRSGLSLYEIFDD